MKYKEAELVVNKLLADFIRETVEKRAIFEDLTEKEVSRLNKAFLKYLSRLAKLQDTLIRQLGGKQ